MREIDAERTLEKINQFVQRVDPSLGPYDAVEITDGAVMAIKKTDRRFCLFGFCLWGEITYSRICRSVLDEHNEPRKLPFGEHHTICYKPEGEQDDS